MHDISVENLTFGYQNKAPFIFENLSCEIKQGQFACLLGQSGCGKSTLLKLISGLEKPTSGNIRVDNEIVNKASLNRGVVFQDYGLFPWMSAGDNVLLALTQKFKDRNKSELKDLAITMLNKVGLDESVYKKYPKELSGGMKQRCAIAQAFAIDPPILLMDEPFGALDAVTRARLQDLLIELWTSQKIKKTIVFVTHDVDEALLLSDRILVLGQSSKSSLIYQCDLSSKKNRGRENQFSDPEILEKRNELIECIYRDVNSVGGLK